MAFPKRVPTRAALTFAPLVLLSSPAFASCTTATCATFSELGSLGGDVSYPVAISADGTVVVGNSLITGGADTHAFRWQGGSIIDLGTFGGTYSGATAVNDDGSVVIGNAYTTGNLEQHAFRWQNGAMLDLGTLGGSYSSAYAVNSDGSVVVGYSNTTGDAALRAFRWQGGSMLDLGTLGGTTSFALAVSSDGSVVAGGAWTTGNLEEHAFRWQGGTMLDLGTLGGSLSYATLISSNGSIVVGQSLTTGNAEQHAFRWQGGTMTDLGTFGGTYSRATAINSEGSVAVGTATTVGDAESHAFLWQGGSKLDLGTLGGTFSNATAVNSDGSVVVGGSTMPDSSFHAFRWSAAGMKDLNALLSNAGVNMAGIVLVDAIGISANGEYITGNDSLSHAYLVRYEEGTGTAGLTTPESIQQSVNGLASSVMGVMAQQHGLAAPLLSDDKPITGKNHVGVFGYGGSASGGGFAQWSADTGLAILAGVSYAQEDIDSAAMTDNVMAAGALRYVMPTGQAWRPFVEGGGWFAPNADLSFDRTYANGAGTATGTGSTQGDLSYLFGRAGVLFDFGSRNQLSVSGEIGKERLNVNGYSETNQNNPFNASVDAGKDQLDIAKVRVVYNFAVTQKVDAALWAAGDFAFARDVDVTAAVPGGGVFSSTNTDNLSWAEFGGRIGYALTDSVTLDVFANGIAGNADEIDTRVHTGADLRYQF